MRKKEYAEGVEVRIRELSASLRRPGYRPEPVRRVCIPEGDGRYRPLGVPCFEDRLVQDRLSLVLQAIREPEFPDCSDGFRPGRSAYDALRRTAEVITNEGTQWVVEADIQGFFDHVSHCHLLRFLEQRIADPDLLRIIRRFLKAGVMEDGVFSATVEGTPQGGLVSPVLSNIHLHYVLDLWFEKRYAKSCGGKACLIRHADDYVACFEQEADARRFRTEMAQRLAQFDLQVEPAKTAVLRFGSQALGPGRRREDEPRTFNFPGFTHYVGRSRQGRFVVGRKTEGKRVQRKLKQLSERPRALRTEGGPAMVAYARRHLQGHIQYYGVSGNSRSVARYVYFATYHLFRWLNRRSQRRSMTWQRFGVLIRRQLPAARIVHNLYPTPLWMTQAGSRMV